MEQRRTRRFKLQLPLAVTRAGTERMTVAGLTKNISSTGVLFTTGRGADLGGPIEYIITLNHDGVRPVSLRCIGKVLRAERIEENGAGIPGYQVAATLERYEFVRER
ncbi:MAG: PilZ domain-containing protein [Acidobacteriia bacterium]|nr:PilZ domain-containing protein [Terriglobia bacterium]